MAPSPAPVMDPPDARRDRFTATFEAHWSAVHAFARRRTTSADDAHDVAAETFAVAWRRFDDIPTEHALPWLYRTAANVLANQGRGDRRRLRLASKAAATRPTERTPLADAIVDDHTLRAAFSSLAREQQELLLLVAWEGLSNAELAVAFDISPNAVASRLKRARHALDAALATSDAGPGHEHDDRTERT